MRPVAAPFGAADRGPPLALLCDEFWFWFWGVSNSGAGAGPKLEVRGADFLNAVMLRARAVFYLNWMLESRPKSPCGDRYLTPSSALSFVSDGRLDEATRVMPASSTEFKAREAGRDGRKGCLALICGRVKSISLWLWSKSDARRDVVPMTRNFPNYSRALG